MLYKENVNLDIQPELAKALPLIDQAHFDCKIMRGAFVTSANDGVHKGRHGNDSLHPKGLALDLRTRDLVKDGEVEMLQNRLRRRLNGDVLKDRPYNIVIELKPPHIHVEYDPE